MASDTLPPDATAADLASQVGSLALNDDINLIEPYRRHIAQLLSQVSGVDQSIISPAIQWTSGLDKGDLIIAVPAMRIKGGKPTELAERFANEVGLWDI